MKFHKNLKLIMKHINFLLNYVKIIYYKMINKHNNNHNNNHNHNNNNNNNNQNNITNKFNLNYKKLFNNSNLIKQLNTKQLMMFKHG